MHSSDDVPVRPFRTKAAAWLQLVRLPNLFTVPGDPVAGLLLACGAGRCDVPAGRVAAVAGASVLLYAAGLVGNDVADMEEDRRDRPSRPLPAGLIDPHAAAWAAGLLAAAGVALALAAGIGSGAVALLLAASVFLYNVRARRHAMLGPPTMALCRALSLLMGAALAVDGAGAHRGLPFVAAAALFVYITAVSVVARNETVPRADMPAGGGFRLRWLPAVGMACGLALVLLMTRTAGGRGLDPLVLVPNATSGSVAAAGALAVCVIATAKADPLRLSGTVGAWVLCLIPLQASWCLWSGSAAGVWAGLALMLAWPLALVAARRFYVS